MTDTSKKQPLRIVLIAHHLCEAGGFSVGRNILSFLPSIAPHHTYFIIMPEELRNNIYTFDKNVQYLHVPPMGFLRRRIFDWIILPSKIRRFNPDVIWGLGNVIIHTKRYFQAILCANGHRVYPRKYAGVSNRWELLLRTLRKYYFMLVLRYVDLVFCQTSVIAHRFARTYQYPADRIKIMPNAISEFVTASQTPPQPNMFTPDGWFTLFFLSKYYPHKNFEFLLKIFQNHRRQLADVRCIISIEPGHHRNVPALLKAIHDEHLDEHIVNVGQLKQEELSVYYRSADAFFYPTFLESLSSSYLEAMYFGLPILTSNLDFATHVCGDAALYFNPWEPESAVTSILTLKSNPSLRDELSEKGEKRFATHFKNWERVISDALEDIERLIDQA